MPPVEDHAPAPLQVRALCPQQSMCSHPALFCTDALCTKERCRRRTKQVNPTVPLLRPLRHCRVLHGIMNALVNERRKCFYEVCVAA